MSERTSATRYARALLDVAIAESDPVQAGRDLEAFAGLLAGGSELARVLTSPGTPQQARVGITTAVVEKLGTVPPVAKLLALLADRGRMGLVPDLVDVYRQRLLEHQNVVRATVTTAAPLDQGQRDALGARLSAVTGKTVQMDVRVDPALIGGVVAQIGSTVYDGSLKTELAHLRQQLVEEA
ncbi:MAG: ATP synthase F1 subunit delta [Vicinamibacterales bacterium]